MGRAGTTPLPVPSGAAYVERCCGLETASQTAFRGSVLGELRMLKAECVDYHYLSNEKVPRRHLLSLVCELFQAIDESHCSANNVR